MSNEDLKDLLRGMEALVVKPGEKLIIKADNRIVPPGMLADLMEELRRFLGNGRAMVIYAPLEAVEFAKVERDEQAATADTGTK